MKNYARKFYQSSAWKMTRRAYAENQCGLCERCGQAGDIVHHRRYITPNNINNPLITLDWANLELLCQDCHNKEHMRKQNSRYKIDETGNILPPRGAQKNKLPREPVEGAKKYSAHART